MTTADHIAIHGIQVDCIIGDLAWERKTRQPLRCDIQVAYDLRRAGASDRLADTINYAAVAATVVETMQGAQCQMLEALAERIASTVLKSFPAAAVSLTLWKNAHFPSAERVSISITRPART